jgi:hypothetical protein
MKIYFILFALLIAQFSFSQETCTAVLKTTKYRVQKGDHIAAILRKLGLEPVFTSAGSLNQFLKLNQLADQNLIEPNDELVIPFKCEEQVRIWKTIDFKEYRLLTLEKIDEKEQKLTGIMPAEDVAVPLLSTPVVVEDQKLNQILKASSQDATGADKSLGLEYTKPDGVSDALRYRMICEGEWTGSECVSRYSVLYLAGGGWYNRYDGTDPLAPGGANNKGLLLSRLNPEFQFGWHNYWSENFKTNLSAGLENSEILPEAREIPIEQDKKILSKIYAEARYETGLYGFGLGIKNYDKLFYRYRFSGLSQPCLSNSPSFTGCGVFVHSANIMAYFANISWIFYKQGKFSYDAKAIFSLLGSGATGGFQVYNGTATDLEFTVRHDRVREYLYWTIHYGTSSQNTSIEMQTSQNLGFVFGYAWKLKDW